MVGGTDDLDRVDAESLTQLVQTVDNETHRLEWQLIAVAVQIEVVRLAVVDQERLASPTEHHIEARAGPWSTRQKVL